MWTDRWSAGLITLVFGVACFACSSNPPATTLPMPVDVSPSELLAAASTALDGGDVVEATRLAGLARAADLTDAQDAELTALEARFGESDPTAGGASDAAGEDAATAFGPASARSLRSASTGRLDAAGVDKLPFFDQYREEGASLRYAWFDLGELSVEQTHEAAPPINRRGLARDRVIVLDLGELLARTGVDAERRAYYGVTRARDGLLLHAYKDVAGRAVTGVTERRDGSVRTLLLRHAY